MRHLRNWAAAAVLAGLGATGLTAPASAGEASDLVFAERGPWQLGDRKLVWAMTHAGPEAPNFIQVRDGSVTLAEVADPSDGKPVLQLEQKTDSRTRRIGPFPVSGGDPMVVFFLENTARDMAALTGGSPFYIRNRIKDAVFRGGEVEREGEVTTVTLRPFADDPNKERMHGFETLSMRFVLGPDPKAPIREMIAETAAPVAPPAPPQMAGQTITPAPYRSAMVLE